MCDYFYAFCEKYGSKIKLLGHLQVSTSLLIRDGGNLHRTDGTGYKKNKNPKFPDWGMKKANLI